MASKLKAHRRNNADEAIQENTRFSVPTNFIYHPNANNTHINAYDNYRASDYGFSKQTYYYKNPFNSNQTHLSKPEIHKMFKRRQQPSQNILQMFKILQGKLDVAKKQLTIKKQHNFTDSNFELNSYQNSEKNSQCESEIKKFFHLQQSTINFQSKKALINIIKSKQRLIIANKIKIYYVSQIVKGTAGLNDRAIQHLTISLQILRSCSGLNLPNQVKLKRLNADLQRLDETSDKKILVLDLDETLLHCFEQRDNENDLQIIADLDNKSEKLYISIRPYAISFLKRMNKYFNIVCFTASQKCYADAILNEIDPNCQLIQARLYRQHCVKLNDNIYAKDLRLITTDLTKIVLVDNSIFSCLYQLDNSIPIIPYYGGQDNQLLSLEKYLEQVQKVEDVRKLNIKTFKLNRYNEFEDHEELVRQLYCNI